MGFLGMLESSSKLHGGPWEHCRPWGALGLWDVSIQAHVLSTLLFPVPRSSSGVLLAGNLPALSTLPHYMLMLALWDAAVSGRTVSVARERVPQAEAP